MNAKVKDTRTWAIGRHLIDLPSDWIYSTGSPVTLSYGLDADFTTVEVRVLGTDVTAERFTDALNERSSQIEQVRHSSGKSMLNSDVRPNATTARLRYFTNRLLTDYRTHELHLLVNDVYVLLKTHSFNNVMAPVEARLTSLAETITTVSDPTRAGPGFGLGPIIIRDWHDQEFGIVKFYPPASNIALEVWISALQPQEDLNMAEQEKRFLRRLHYAVLRSKPLTLAGMRSEQRGISYRNGDHHAFLFIAQSYRDTPSFVQPSIHLRLRGGGAVRRPLEPGQLPDLVRWSLPRFVPNKYAVPLWQQPPAPPRVDATLTNAEAGAVWDAMLASIRLRHNAVAPKPPSAFDRPGNPEKAAADKRALDEFLSTDDKGMPWTPPADGN
ncbi:T6SS immunity protein Tli4 family protein [Achromobacter kerstersii]|uniref:T6SS immunity protein Tli4 family protein n=1 Tax=Achromobacter kerstersii TaxID=1353890 RepID=UPI0006BF352C|nr:T6SS immunity protein Tli4 family protein [Achromobacter kerstersii]CUJ52159.1 Uncharacterised protein [Achromobacter kerstersii]